jgi:hypothetical protein
MSSLLIDNESSQVHQTHDFNKIGGVKIVAGCDTLKSPAYLTPWSLVHIGSGIVFYLFMKRFFPSFSNTDIGLTWLNVGTFYEIKDMYHTYVFKDTDYNTFPNSMGDIICNMIGFFIATQLFQNSSKHFDIMAACAYIVFFIFMCIYFPETG